MYFRCEEVEPLYGFRMLEGGQVTVMCVLRTQTVGGHKLSFCRYGLQI
jgi:hypothetical protein